MADVRLTRRYRFSAAHRLHSGLLSEEQNNDIYGKCNNPHGHGHDYVMDVTIRGDVDPVRGRLLSIDALDLFVQTVVLNNFDRRNLNVEVSEFATLVPTTEALAQVIARRLSQAWAVTFQGNAARFEKLRIWETRNNIFEILAQDAVRLEHEFDEISQSRS